MRAVVQRVHKASVTAAGQVAGAVEAGLLVYVGIDRNDTEADARYLAEKVRYLRIFPDADKPLNRDVRDVGGAVLVVSAFTVQADARRGRRPALDNAAPGDHACVLYLLFCDILAGFGVRVARGVFGDHMEVSSLNDGPVCILLDSRRSF